MSAIICVRVSVSLSVRCESSLRAPNRGGLEEPPSDTLYTSTCMDMKKLSKVYNSVQITLVNTLMIRGAPPSHPPFCFVCSCFSEDCASIQLTITVLHKNDSPIINTSQWVYVFIVYCIRLQNYTCSIIDTIS